MTAECEVCGSPARWTCLVDGGDTINDAGYAEARGERRVMLCDDCRDEDIRAYMDGARVKLSTCPACQRKKERPS